MDPIKISTRWLYYIAVCVFVIAKIPHLYEPFYWDESWVYAPAVSCMYEHGPSLRPDAIPFDFSRGHPTLFHATCAAWMNIFGNSHCSMHSFALMVSVLLAIALYEIMFRLFNSRVALMGGIMLLLNVSFYVASSLVLTDIALTLFAFLSLYSYSKGKYGYAVITLTLLYYMKESGWVMAFVIMSDIAIDVFSKKILTKVMALKCITLVLPLVLSALYCIAQKNIYGWYLNPWHVNIINLGILNTFFNFQRSLSIIFYSENVYLFYLLLGTLWLLLLIRTRKQVYIIALSAGSILYLHIVTFNYKDLVFYLFVVATIVALVLFFIRKIPERDKGQERFVKLTVAFCVAYVYFSCVNFFEVRYMFPALFLVSIVLLPILFERVIAKFPRYAYVTILCLMVLVGFSSFNADSNELLLHERLDVQQKLVDYLENNNFYNQKIGCSFLNHVHLTDAKTGFMHSAKKFQNVSEKITDSTELVVVDNIEYGNEYFAVKENPSFSLLYRYVKKRAWVEIYQRKNADYVQKY